MRGVVPLKFGVLVGFALFARPIQAQSQPTRPGAGDQRVVVASKPFGESYLLCEMFSQLLESHGFSVDRRPGLGATEIAFGALRTNAIDVYPEYTGTGLIAILHDSLPDSVAADPRKVFAHVARRFAQLYHVRWPSAAGIPEYVRNCGHPSDRGSVSSANPERSRAGESAPHGRIHRRFHWAK